MSTDLGWLGVLGGSVEFRQAFSMASLACVSYDCSLKKRPWKRQVFGAGHDIKRANEGRIDDLRS